MPVLHKYKSNDSYYVLTSINKIVITFQLTDQGLQKLRHAGFSDGDGFGRGLLLDLYRTGDAFTYGSGVKNADTLSAKEQLALDFTDDPTPESIFPSCSMCSSLSDLHLVELKEKETVYLSILCSDCRSGKSSAIDSSIPLPLVSRAVLGAFARIKDIHIFDASVDAYRKVLDQEFSDKWNAHLKAKTVKQGLLMPPDDPQGSLI